MKNHICYICKNNSTVFEEECDIIYKGVSLPLTIKYCICNHCKKEFIPSSLIRQNDEIVKKVKEEYDEICENSLKRSLL
jgi:hypothetical protein